MPKSRSRSRSDEAEAAKLTALLDSAVDAIVTIDHHGNIDTVNRATEHLFQYGVDELLGRNVKMLMPEPYQSEHDGYLSRYSKTGDRKIIGIGREVTGRRKDGSVFPMHLSVSEFRVGEKVFFTGIIHDLSAREHAEEALRQAQKMEAIGQLTGGVAHDFNNLLTVIVGNLELLEARLKDKDQLDLLSEAQEAAELGAKLTDRLLTFARRSPLAPAVVDLNSLVLGLMDMLHRTLGETVELSTALSTGLWLTRADPAQVESSMINLAVNARDAMPEGGRLIIETRNAEMDEPYAAAEAGLSPGEYVQLSVTDTGTGMPEEVRRRAFEPFFTTKEVGRGTGLGLPMVYGFAKQSGGHLTIYSEFGKGTTINLYLPRYKQSGTATAAAADKTAPALASGELVLVVEDDARVRRLTLTRLRELGYRVLESANGREALAVFAENPAIDLVFSDLVMPGGMSGYDLLAELRKQQPRLKVLLTSGYAEELAHAERLQAQGVRVLRKPYRIADLANAIRKALNGD